MDVDYSIALLNFFFLVCFALDRFQGLFCQAKVTLVVQLSPVAALEIFSMGANFL